MASVTTNRRPFNNGSWLGPKHKPDCVCAGDHCGQADALASSKVKATKRRASRGYPADQVTAMADFVEKHQLRCFNCGENEFHPAKTGTSKRGPWAICITCVRKQKL
jgi:hypothetical protein